MVELPPPPKLVCVFQLPFPPLIPFSIPPTPTPNPSPLLHLFHKNPVVKIVIQKNTHSDKTSEPNEFTTRGDVCPLVPVFVLPSFLFSLKLLLWVGHCAQSGNTGACKTWHFCPGSGNRHVEKSLYPGYNCSTRSMFYVREKKMSKIQE